jgi:hypothetical protein
MGTGIALNMRIVTLVCACALSFFASEAFFAFDAAAQNAAVGMGGGPGSPAEMKQNSVHPPAGELDPAARSAKSTECLQKADAQALQGKLRRHFLHECKGGA